MRNLLFILAAGLLFTSTILSQADEINVFTPNWKVGDQWTVKAIYPSHMDETTWSSPIYWDYTVAGQTDCNQQSCLILEITQQNGKDKSPSARLLIRQSDYRLVLLETQKVRRGKTLSRSFTFEHPAPLSEQQTIVPIDFPVFPLISGSTQTYAITKNVTSELKQTRTIRQTVTLLSGSQALPDRIDDKKLLKVSCVTDKGDLLFEQYWDKDYPWPLYGYNQNMKYWLIRTP